MNTCGLQDDIIMNKSCTDCIIVNKTVLTESACFKITNTDWGAVTRKVVQNTRPSFLARVGRGWERG